MLSYKLPSQFNGTSARNTACWSRRHKQIFNQNLFYYAEHYNNHCLFLFWIWVVGWFSCCGWVICCKWHQLKIIGWMCKTHKNSGQSLIACDQGGLWISARRAFSSSGNENFGYPRMLMARTSFLFDIYWLRKHTLLWSLWKLLASVCLPLTPQMDVCRLEVVSLWK